MQKTRRDQKLYAQAMLEDATGKIELIAFPRDYEKLSASLKIEAPVLIRGVLSGNDDDAAPKLSLLSIQTLEDVQVKLPTGLRIRINLDRATEQLLYPTQERIGCRARARQSSSGWRYAPDRERCVG